MASNAVVSSVLAGEDVVRRVSDQKTRATERDASVGGLHDTMRHQRDLCRQGEHSLAYAWWEPNGGGAWCHCEAKLPIEGSELKQAIKAKNRRLASRS